MDSTPYNLSVSPSIPLVRSVHLRMEQLAKSRSIRSSRTGASWFLVGSFAAISEGERNAPVPASEIMSIRLSSMADFSTIGRIAAFANRTANLPTSSSSFCCWVAGFGWVCSELPNFEVCEFSESERKRFMGFFII